MRSLGCQALIFLALLSSIVPSHQRSIEASSTFSSLTHPINGGSVNGGSPDFNGTRWAILVAGSAGWENYRHQADVCHAYQILKKGGVKEENIVVFMYDDVAFDKYNPRPGILINKPYGNDVYGGVPKDYTGKHCNVDNLIAVILGNKSALTGGSGKVVNSGPNDYIFIFYADHGAPGLVSMPYGDNLYGKDLIEVLKKKHATNSYKTMVIYLEACESGSMFDGLLPNNLNIYAVTASNPNESSWGFYCPGFFPSPPQVYEICLGDLFSISWMEDSDIHDLAKETLAKQYHVVKRRTGVDNLEQGSHVMRYGDKKIGKEFVSVYMGINPENDNYTLSKYTTQTTNSSTQRVAVNQRDSDLVFYRYKYEKAPEGSLEKYEAYKKLQKVLSHRKHVDETMNHIARQLFGEVLGIDMQKLARPAGQPLVDDWNCLKNMCGPLLVYGKKHTRAFANMCNAGVTVGMMNLVAKEACTMRSTPPASS